MTHPLVELTFGPMPAPEVAFDPISKEFWMTWRGPNTRIDVTLTSRDELRALVLAALAAAAESDHEEAHAEPHAGVT